MISGYLRTAYVWFFLLWASSGFAQQALPPLTGRVIDQTATLNVQQITNLEQSLQAFENSKGSQIVVLLVATTTPETIEQYAIRAAEQWKLGRKKIDDGVLLVIAKNDRALRIEVGYGLEGALNDAVSKRIISETITPYFQRNDFYGGIRAGLKQIMAVIQGEALPAVKQSSQPAQDSWTEYLPLIFLFAVVLGGVMRAVFGRFLGGLIGAGIVGLAVWFFIGTIIVALGAGLVTLLFIVFGGALSAWAGIYHRGRGGSGRGNFRGGGGGFGGGGASGRW